MKITNDKFRGIFVTADDPKFLEEQVSPEQDFIATESLDLPKIHEYRMQRGKNFDTTPFDPDGRMFRLYPGGYTVWSGYPGAGKTTILRQLACHLMHRGSGVFIACMEDTITDVFADHACVAIGREEPSQADYEWAAFAWADKLRLWAHEALPASHQRMLAAIRLLAKRGVRHAIIDSLMCLDVHSTDWEGQRLFANALKRTLQASGVHIHLVAHPRKVISADQQPDINDIAGAADIGRFASNVIFIRRPKDDALVVNSEMSPMRINILKQRGFRGTVCEITGWLSRNTKQFVLDRFDTSRQQYLPKEAYQDGALGGGKW